MITILKDIFFTQNTFSRSEPESENIDETTTDPNRTQNYAESSPQRFPNSSFEDFEDFGDWTSGGGLQDLFLQLPEKDEKANLLRGDLSQDQVAICIMCITYITCITYISNVLMP